MEIDLPDVVAEVRAAFDRYEKALVTNDVTTLDELFRDDPRTIRYGATEILYGSERPTAPGKIGRQTQTWVKFPEGWRVVVGHVSLMDKPAAS